jgi:hypothetical protein
MAILRSRVRLLRAAVGLALLLGASQLGACFNPAQPGCAFSCASDGLCPSGYSCGGDRLCHRDDGQGSCAIQTDAAGTDAARDARRDTTLDTTPGQ